MRDLSADDRLPIQPRPLSSGRERQLHIVATYSSLALIAAIVLGSLSVHPF